MPVECTARLEHLVLLPSSAELQAEVAKHEAELARLEQEYPPTCPTAWGIDPARQRERERLQWAQERVADGAERDRLASERPECCWCLGVGGRGRVLMYNSQVHRFTTYCPCPDGAEAEAIAEAEKTRLAEEREREERSRLFYESRVPTRFRRCAFSTYPRTPETDALVTRLEFWIDGPAEEAGDDAWDTWKAERKESLLLYGAFGTGKTGLAVSVLKRFIHGWREPALFVTVPELLDIIRAGYDKARPSGERDLLREAKTVPLLVLDDLGAERVTDWVQERLFVIINARHDEELATIFTSNLGPDELGDHLGERITWRIVEMCDVIHLAGPNLRDRRK